MKYCYECGEKLEFKYLEDEGMIPYCNKCQKFIFPHFSVAVSMIVLNEDMSKTLFIQQYGRKANILVAGYVNKGESLEEAVERELMEEVSLKPKIMKFNSSQYYPKSNSLLCNFIVICSDMEYHRKENEVDLVNWFSLADAKEAILKNSLAEKFLITALEKIKTEI